MIMNVKKRLWSLACIVLPGVGFAMICTGSYLVSQQLKYEYSMRVTAYVMIVFGIPAAFIGIFWTNCHSMKSKMYQRGGHEQHTHVYTIER